MEKKGRLSIAWRGLRRVVLRAFCDDVVNRLVGEWGTVDALLPSGPQCQDTRQRPSKLMVGWSGRANLGDWVAASLTLT